MRRVGRILVRLLIVALSLTIGVALAEGGYKIATGRSLIDRLLFPDGGASGGMRLGYFDEERIDAARLTVGPRAVDPDPAVGFTMKWNDERKIVDAIARTDAFGQRVRVGPEPEAGAPHVVLLGDSVAFGFGVADDQTFMHHLENQLAATLAEGAKRPIVTTIACPDWNNRAQIRYLQNHLGRVNPDVVILMSVTNDLDDQHHVNEFGGREPGYDPAIGPHKPHATADQFWQLWRAVKDRLPRLYLMRLMTKDSLHYKVMHVIMSGLGPDSKRRWSQLRNRTLALARRLEARGCKFMMALRYQDPFELMLDQELRSVAPDIAIRYFFSNRMPYDRLETDSHPGPAFVRAGAWCMADELIKRSWLPGVGARPLPPLEERFRERLATTPPLGEVTKRVAEHRDRMRGFLEPGIDLSTGRGFHQVYGGVLPTGHVGKHVLLALRNDGGPSIAVDLTRLPEDSAVYPLSLTAAINGVRSSPIEIPPPAAGKSARWSVSFPIPQSVRSDSVLDVQIDASQWVVQRILHKSALVAWRLQSIRIRDEAAERAAVVPRDRDAIARDLGSAKGARGRPAPRLTLKTTPDGKAYLDLRNAPPSALGYIVYSAFRRPTQSFGGTIVPDLTRARSVDVTAGPDGSKILPIPPDLAFTEVYVQMGFQDEDATDKTALSNALHITWK